MPAEIYPELVLGGIQDPQDPGADFPGAPRERALFTLLRAEYKLVFGLANDEIGYVIPRSQWDAKAPFAYGRARTNTARSTRSAPRPPLGWWQAFEACSARPAPLASERVPGVLDRRGQVLPCRRRSSRARAPPKPSTRPFGARAPAEVVGRERHHLHAARRRLLEDHVSAARIVEVGHGVEPGPRRAQPQRAAAVAARRPRSAPRAARGRPRACAAGAARNGRRA